ncbi:type I methionyl aminopeptidase [Candidatus Eisenbacteria bacterium]|uniref:Methionine aminopeptidase n=1 Tax=Eiseniibacteriota bacterium TaxID=2212470 RepID=A0ABV6YKX0_UNCEI
MIAQRRPDEVDKIAESARIVAGALRLVKREAKEGVTTKELDTKVEAFIRSEGATPSFKGYRGFPASTCISVNDVVVHGIPSEQTLRGGDVVSIDVGAYKDGYHGDGAWTFPVGEICDEATRLLEVTREALHQGIDRARPGSRLGQISNAIQRHVESNGFSVVRMLVGHGIGTELHEEPQVPNFGSAQQGPTLAPGMVLAIEPMVNMGGYEVYTQKDGWTVVTQDSSLSAHFEHTVVITENGPRILTTPGPGDTP